MMRFEVLLLVLELLNRVLELAANLWPYWQIFL